MNTLDFKAIGCKIKERRVSMGLTQEEIANELDVNPSHISNIECGRAQPSLKRLVKIANILECSVDYFIGGEYSYLTDTEADKTLENEIMEKIKYFDPEKKQKVSQMIDLL